MKISHVFILLVFVAMACSNERETPKGYKYTLAAKGDGEKVAPGKFLVMSLLLKDEKDSVWYDNKKNDAPEIIPTRDTTGMSSEEGLDEIFRLLTKGDSVTMTIPAQTLFEKTWGQPVPQGVDPKRKLTFYLKVNDVLDSTAVMSLQQQIVARQNEKMMKEQAEQLKKDSVIISDYLKGKNIDALRTPSGLRYLVQKAGKGENAQVGQTVRINYAGYLLSGKYFDTSWEKIAKEQGMYTPGRPYEPYEIVIGQTPLIQGWDEIMLLMNKGTKLTVWVPSPLAYGKRRRSEDIVENSILVFDMEMVDIK
ncbi:MAG: FKBP-type peptidyl-prolyl cis-trans isomerase [Bacteroidota bacterium]